MKMMKRTIFGWAIVALLLSFAACSSDSSSEPEIPVITGFEFEYELCISEDAYGAADYSVAIVVNDGEKRVEALETTQMKDVEFVSGTQKCRVWSQTYSSNEFPATFQLTPSYELNELDKENYTVVFHQTNKTTAIWSDGSRSLVTTMGVGSVVTVPAANLGASLDIKMKQAKVSVTIELDEEKNEITIK